MATYLLTWNPKRFAWEELPERIREVRENGSARSDWSVGSTKRIKPGDRLFMIRLGKEPRGIMASGWATSEWFPDPHWDPELAAEGKETISIKLDFDVLLDADERIFPFARLSEGIYKKVWWTPQGSGKSIPDDVAEQLENDWARFLGKPLVRPGVRPEHEAAVETYVEGANKQVVMSVHERNPAARRKCIERHGTTCVICGFNFGEVFGEFAEGFIHVHHLELLSSAKGPVEVDPEEDMRPVCPNCHAAIHLGGGVRPIDEVKALLERRRR